MEHLFYYLAYLFDVCSNIASTKLTSSKISLTGAKSGEFRDISTRGVITGN